MVSAAQLQAGSASAVDLALYRAIPELAGKLPRVACTQLPTRVQHLERLGEHLGTSRLWIKRDDESGALYGGNKPRKLEFLLGDAIARGKKTVMTFGGTGTNHGLATAIYARHYGLRTILLLLDQPVTEKVRRGLLLYHAYGAEMHYAKSLKSLVAQSLAICGRELVRGGLPYVIPTGGSAPIGVLGYVNAAFELKEQIQTGELPEPEWIFVPVGTAGTLAGLVLGCRLASLRTRIAGVIVTNIHAPTPESTARLANRAYAILRGAAPHLGPLSFEAGDVHMVEGFMGERYGMPTEAARAVRDQMESLEGIHSETTYTAKCLAAIAALSGQPPYRDGNLLYVHTYSSADPVAAIGKLPDYHELPEPFHPIFEGPTVED